MSLGNFPRNDEMINPPQTQILLKVAAKNILMGDSCFDMGISLCVVFVFIGVINDVMITGHTRQARSAAADVTACDP